MTRNRLHPLLLVGVVAWFIAIHSPVPCSRAASLQDERREFQAQQLTTAKSFTFVFNGGEPPRIVWRDLEAVRRLGCNDPLRVRWFDADLNEVGVPSRPGRWGAYIEATAPNGTPLRRAMTFYCRPPGFFLYGPSTEILLGATYLPGPIAADVWREHTDEISLTLADNAFRALNDSEAGAVLIAGLSESKALGRRARSIDAAAP
jgi:hypothetical protein